jgi:hypothetical protein
VDDSLLEPVNQPPSVGIFADDLPASIMPRLRVINRFLEFDPQSSEYAGGPDIGERPSTQKQKTKADIAKPPAGSKHQFHYGGRQCDGYRPC